MAPHFEDKIVTPLRWNRFSALQVAESTDITNKARLWCFVRYEFEKKKKSTRISNPANR
jgi:hypothetical protein